MRLFNSDCFTYRNNELYCEEIPAALIAENYGTPVYVYSKKFFTDRYKEFTEAFSEINHRVFFASKSNFNLNVIKIFADLGAGIDVNSAGELYRAKKAGVNPKDMLFSGVGKTAEEIKEAIENNVLILKAESLGEAHLINKLAGDLGKIAPIAFRVNPDVNPETHPYISTGLAENKFGISSDDTIAIFKEADALPNLDVCGIDMHIGSQITKISPYVEAVQKMAELFLKLTSDGIELKHFDIGGGMGITYDNETPFTPKELAKELVPIFKTLDCEILFEPGRSLTANGGVLLSEVLYTKKNNQKNFIVADAAMTDLLRPSIYGAYHHIQPAKIYDRNDITADIVGPVCESGDFLAKDREITISEPGELLSIMSAGAYGQVMASNYNARRRPPEIIIDGDKHYSTRSRETFEHLLFDEVIVDDLHR
ncbi:MAG: diaminopimelate decarboxylase [Ignavibacteriae bacterium]|nr:diaminopimelate decarboxylase [Ignavibacteriota bacterium]NOG98167.1 diaminopimelate decarboxylase [Ignavibacteriota bacterium]